MPNSLNAMLVKQSSASQTIDLKAKFGEGYSFKVVSSNNDAVEAVINDKGQLTLDYGKLGYSDIRIVATKGLETVTDDFRVRVAGDDAYTIAILPDVQDYTKGNADPQILNRMTQWLVDNKDSLGIQFVTQTGDVTYNNTRPEWINAEKGLRILDGKIPYSFSSGNHDLGAGGNGAVRDQDFLSEYFSVEKQKAILGENFGGVYDKEPNSYQNNYTKFTAPDGTKWISLSLEFGPRDDVLRWAGDVIEQNPDARVTISTHAYMAGDGRINPTSEELTWDNGGPGYDVGKSPEGSSDGDGMWANLVSKYPNIAMVFSGHNFIDGAETQIDYGAGGQPVLQMFMNYQNGVARELTGNGDPSKGDNGGNGAIRLVTVDPQNNAVYTETYFTELDDYLDGFRGKAELDRDGLTGSYRGHQEEISDIDFSTPGAWSLAKAGDDKFVTATEGDTAAVTLDAGKTIVGKGADLTYTWKDADGNVVATGAKPTVDFESGSRVITLEVRDAKGNVSTDDIRVVVSGERTLLVDNFNDGKTDGWAAPAAPQTLVKFGSSADFNLPAMNGGLGDVLSFPDFSNKQYLKLDPEVATMPADGKIWNYSLVMDILIPDEEAWTSILQTRLNNGDDAELYLRNDGGGKGSFGSMSEYQGTFQYGQWQRVAFTFEYNSGTDKTVISKFIEGQFVGSQTTSDPSRYTIDAKNGFLLFTDDGADTSRGYTSSILFSDKTLSREEIVGFGKADADGISSAAIDGATQFDFRNGNLKASWGEGRLMTPDASQTATDFKVVGTVQTRGNEGELSDSSGAKGNILIWNDAEAQNWSDYVFEVTLDTTDRTGQLGVVFNYQDAKNFYRLTFDVNGDARILTKVQDGVETQMAKASQGIAMGVESDLKVVSLNGEIRVFLNDKDIFDGPIADANPLEKGTVGVISNEQRTASFDDVVVNKASLSAHGESAGRAMDVDGDGTAEVALTAKGSYGPNEISDYRWMLDGKEIGRGETLSVELPAGTKGVTLEVTDTTGKVSRDFVKVEVAEKADILVNEGFDGETISADWKMVDEGERVTEMVPVEKGPAVERVTNSEKANWYIKEGELVQDANVYSRQLLNSQNANDLDIWGRGYSPLGDGDYILRKGTYMLYDAEGAKEWSDYSIEMTVNGGGNDSLGLMFYYQDPNNYYKLELDNEFGLYQLTRIVEGVESIVARTAGRYTPGADEQLRVDVKNNVIDVFLDGERIFVKPIEDRNLDGGTFGLYNWGANGGVSYDNIKVVSIANKKPPQPPVDPVNTAPTDLAFAGGTIAENAAIGAVVGTLSAKDAEGNAINWTISGGDGKFSLQTVGGAVQVVVNGALDFETKSSYTITATASDGSLTTSRDFTISIGDVDEGGGDPEPGNPVDGDKGDNRLEGDSGDNAISGKGGDDELFGRGGNDELRGGAGSDTLRGGKGDDILIGGAGADQLYGGAGADTFVFTKVGQSNAVNTDTIYAFRPGQGDVIDLSGIDANGKKGGNQDFDFIGQQDFSGKAGELRFEKSKDGTVIEGDTNGDGKADFVLNLDGKYNVAADYFEL